VFRLGFSTIVGADFCNPPLTTLTAPIDQAGRVATDMLMGAIQDRWGSRSPGVCG